MPDNTHLYRTGINVNKDQSEVAKQIVNDIQAGLTRYGGDLQASVGIQIDTKDIQKKLAEIQKIITGSLKNTNMNVQVSNVLGGFKDGFDDVQKVAEAVNKLYDMVKAFDSLPKVDVAKLSGLSSKELDTVYKRLQAIQSEQDKINQKALEAQKKYQDSIARATASTSGLVRSNKYKDSIANVNTNIPEFSALDAAFSGDESSAAMNKRLSRYKNLVAIYKQLSDEVTGLLNKASSGQVSDKELFNVGESIEQLKLLRSEILKVEQVFLGSGVSQDKLASNFQIFKGSSLPLSTDAGLEGAANRAADAYINAFKARLSENVEKLQLNLSTYISDAVARKPATGIEVGGGSISDSSEELARNTDQAADSIAKYLVSADEAVQKINELDERLSLLDRDSDSTKELREYGDLLQEQLKYYVRLKSIVDDIGAVEDLPRYPEEYEEELGFADSFIDDVSYGKKAEQIKAQFLSDIQEIQNRAREIGDDVGSGLEQAEISSQEVKTNLDKVETSNADELVQDLNKAEQSAENINKEISGDSAPSVAGVQSDAPRGASDSESKEGTVLSDAEPVRVNVEPEIDPAYFIGQVQNELDASGASVKIPVDISQEDSEIAKQVEGIGASIGQKISEATNEAIRNSLDVSDAVKTAVDQSVNETVAESVKTATDAVAKEAAETTKAKTSSGSKKKSQKSAEEKQFDADIKRYEKLTEKVRQYYELRQKLATGDITERQRTTYADLDRQFGELDNFLSTVSVSSDEARKKVDALRESLEKAKNIAGSTLKDSMMGSLDSLYDDFASRAPHRSEGFVTELSNIRTLMEQLRSYKPVNLLNDDELQDWAQLRQAIDEAFSALKKNEKLYGDVDVTALNKARSGFETFVSRNSSLLNDRIYGPQIQAIRSMFASAKTTDDLNKTTAAVAKLRAETAALNKTGQSFGDIWMDKMRSMAAWMASFGSVYDVINKVQSGIQSIIEYDTALTNLGKVADATTNQLREFGQAAYDVADGIGATNIAVIEASAEWARLGYSIQEAGELARASTIYANVGELPADEATKSLVSTMKAFDMQSDQVMNVVDILNEVGNRYATSSSELGDILQRSAAAMSVAGDDLEGVVALGTGMQEVLQNAESVGTTLKTLSMRIRSTKSEIEEAGLDTAGMANSVSGLRDQILALTNVTGEGGFDIIDPNTGGYKSILEIVNGVADVYDKMSSLDQAALLELMAGKRGGNALAAAIANIDTINKVYETAMNAEGSAERENQKYVESIQGQLNILQNQWDKLWTTPINQDVMLFVIDLGQAALEAADNIGILGVALAGLGGVAFLKDLGRLDLRAA